MGTYIANRHKMKVHRSDCPYVNPITKNMYEYEGTLEDAISDGYTLCKDCISNEEIAAAQNPEKVLSHSSNGVEQQNDTKVVPVESKKINNVNRPQSLSEKIKSRVSEISSADKTIPQDRQYGDQGGTNHAQFVDAEPLLTIKENLPRNVNQTAEAGQQRTVAPADIKTDEELFSASGTPAADEQEKKVSAAEPYRESEVFQEQAAITRTQPAVVVQDNNQVDDLTSAETLINNGNVQEELLNDSDTYLTHDLERMNQTGQIQQQQNTGSIDEELPVPDMLNGSFEKDVNKAENSDAEVVLDGKQIQEDIKQPAGADTAGPDEGMLNHNALKDDLESETTDNKIGSPGEDMADSSTNNETVTPVKEKRQKRKFLFKKRKSKKAKSGSRVEPDILTGIDKEVNEDGFYNPTVPEVQEEYTSSYRAIAAISLISIAAVFVIVFLAIYFS